jgi:hypothetical protein
LLCALFSNALSLCFPPLMLDTKGCELHVLTKKNESWYTLDISSGYLDTHYTTELTELQ